MRTSAAAVPMNNAREIIIDGVDSTIVTLGWGCTVPKKVCWGLGPHEGAGTGVHSEFVANVPQVRRAPSHRVFYPAVTPTGLRSSCPVVSMLVGFFSSS